MPPQYCAAKPHLLPPEAHLRLAAVRHTGCPAWKSARIFVQTAIYARACVTDSKRLAAQTSVQPDAPLRATAVSKPAGLPAYNVWLCSTARACAPLAACTAPRSGASAPKGNKKPAPVVRSRLVHFQPEVFWQLRVQSLATKA